ncbi:MAG: hypothetical protein J5659_03430 [Clostridia bacterium]|nr:hypothetical protein [Clostridia bacterium]
MDGIFTPEFLQAACAKAEPANLIRLHVSEQLEEMSLHLDMSYNGSVMVTYVRNGETITKVVDENPFLIYEPDANTYVTIKGDVSRLSISSPPNYVIDAIYAEGSKSLMSLTTNSGVETLQIGKYLTYLTVNGTSLNAITYPANNNAVSSAIANAITNANADDGTVYTDENGTYFDVIANAATAKGWTIQELN